MKTVLAIETATEVCSVALFQGPELIDCVEQGGTYSHAENLAVFTEKLLHKNQLNVKDLDAIAFSEGPGSYTGLRIGLAFAKGLCYSNQISLMAVSTLKCLAHAAQMQVDDQKGIFIPMLDARRMEVYTAVYSSQLDSLEPVQAKVIDKSSFETYLNQNPVFFFGNGAAKCRDILASTNANFELEILNSAKYMGVEIEGLLKKNSFVDLAYYEPNYLKEFLAIKAKPLI